MSPEELKKGGSHGIILVNKCLMKLEMKMEE